MSVQNENKTTAQDSQQASPGEQHGQSEQAKRDAEIEEMQQHSKHQPPGLEKPPEVPPAPPRTAPVSYTHLDVYKRQSSS